MTPLQALSYPRVRGAQDRVDQAMTGDGGGKIGAGGLAVADAFGQLLMGVTRFMASPLTAESVL